MSETVVIAAGAAGPILGAAISYFVIRRLAARTLTPVTARCSRCTKEVPASELRLWSELRMRCCSDCDRQLTGLLFPDPSSTDYDPAVHQGHLQAYREIVQAAKPTA